MNGLSLLLILAVLLMIGWMIDVLVQLRNLNTTLRKQLETEERRHEELLNVAILDRSTRREHI
jgi:CHASE3 domain sensor protein